MASSFLTVHARVARALLQFARQLGEEAGPGRILIRHRITQSDLAAMAGVARESVSRTFREWHRQKILEGSSRTGYVVHKARLERVAAESGRNRETARCSQYCGSRFRCCGRESKTGPPTGGRSRGQILGTRATRTAGQQHGERPVGHRCQKPNG